MFGSRVFTQIKPVWVDDLGAWPEIHNFDGAGLKNRHFVLFSAVANIAKNIYSKRLICSVLSLYL
jgi:hypothetical protein